MSEQVWSEVAEQLVDAAVAAGEVVAVGERADGAVLFAEGGTPYELVSPAFDVGGFAPA